MEKLIEHLLGSGDLKKSFARIGHYFIPKVDDTRNLLERLRTDAPFMSMIPLNIIEVGGFTTAKIGSMDEDFEGRLHHELGRTIGFYQPFLEYALSKLRERHALTVDGILDFICESLFSPTVGMGCSETGWKLTSKMIL